MSDVEGPRPQQSPADEPDEKFRKTTWQGTADINRQNYSAVAKEVEFERRYSDLKMQMGQMRALTESHVVKLVTSLTERPPKTCVKATARHNHDDNRLYLLAGQHIVKVIAKIGADKESKGLRLERWHRTVMVDILKHETPLDIRKLVTSASNASTHVQRSTIVTECLTSISRDESGTAKGGRRTQRDDVGSQTETATPPGIRLCVGRTTEQVVHGILLRPGTAAGGRAAAYSADVSEGMHAE